jgi:hypothetical protein
MGVTLLGAACLWGYPVKARRKGTVTATYRLPNGGANVPKWELRGRVVLLFSPVSGIL